MQVLIYVDGSRYGRWAVDFAGLLLDHFPLQVTLLTTESDDPRRQERVKQARRRLESKDHPTIVDVTQPGTAEEAIIAESAGRPYDLILLAPAGRGTLARLLHGSRVATVVRASNTAVFVVRSPVERIARVLVCVGGTRQSLDTVNLAAQWGEAFGAGVTILHVVSQLPLMFRGLTAEEGHRGIEELLSIEPEARPLLQQAIAELDARGLLEQWLVREGLVEEQVLRELEDGRYDLLVIGAHATGGMNRLLLDDLCDRLVQKSPVSTLVAR